jgi:hypothetical protein
LSGRDCQREEREGDAEQTQTKRESRAVAAVMDETMRKLTDRDRTELDQLLEVRHPCCLR